jgi:hypothetical protein
MSGEMSAKQERYMYHRMARLPDMIEATERKLQGLYREAERYGMREHMQGNG